MYTCVVAKCTSGVIDTKKVKTQVYEEDWHQSDIDALLRLQLSQTVLNEKLHGAQRDRLLTNPVFRLG